MIVRTLRPLLELGAGPIAIVVGYQAAEVEAALRRAYPHAADLRFVRQERQRGTGDAARCGIEALSIGTDTPTLVIYGDMPRLTRATLASFLDAHEHWRAALSLTTIEMAEPGAYGRVVRGSDGAVRAVVEARDAGSAELAIKEINAGVYLAPAGLLRRMLPAIGSVNAQGEVYLTDLVGMVSGEDLAVRGFRAPQPAEFAGINSLEELAEVNAEIRKTVNQKLMARGVTIVDPDAAYIGEEVEIGADSVIGPNVQIMGRSRIGSEVVIEGSAWLSDVEIGDRSHLKIGIRAERCRIGEQCEVGPFANLREGTQLAGHNRVGNFVETKQAQLGWGTKASHLSYLGDVTIGAETNIGCGVITVNYDGYDKHRTQVGDRCMIGCDSQLIAPVKVGDDAYVASGTTVMRDVAEGALATSHHPQREKAGWAASWRERHAARTTGAEAAGSHDNENPSPVNGGAARKDRA